MIPLIFKKFVMHFSKIIEVVHFLLYETHSNFPVIKMKSHWHFCIENKMHSLQNTKVTLFIYFFFLPLNQYNLPNKEINLSLCSCMFSPFAFVLLCTSIQCFTALFLREAWPRFLLWRGQGSSVLDQRELPYSLRYIP